MGKSSFAVALAARLDGEIIGADAFQIYKGLPLLTSQPGPELLGRVPHHLIGVLALTEHCDAAWYAGAAKSRIAEVLARGRTPILVGGTGLYIKALTHGLADFPPPDGALRARIAAMELPEALARLGEADAEAPARIDIRNPVRVRRALEIVLSTGQPLAVHRSTWAVAGSHFCGIVLEREREELRRRIADNVDAMFAAGVVDEVRDAGDVGAGAARAIGFCEIRSLLRGEIDLRTCRDAIVTATQRYAKRQLTWCRNQFSFPVISLTATPPPFDSIVAALDQLGRQDA